MPRVSPSRFDMWLLYFLVHWGIECDTDSRKENQWRRAFNQCLRHAVCSGGPHPIRFRLPCWPSRRPTAGDSCLSSPKAAVTLVGGSRTMFDDENGIDLSRPAVPGESHQPFGTVLLPAPAQLSLHRSVAVLARRDGQLGVDSHTSLGEQPEPRTASKAARFLRVIGRGSHRGAGSDPHNAKSQCCKNWGPWVQG